MKFTNNGLCFYLKKYLLVFCLISLISVVFGKNDQQNLKTIHKKIMQKLPDTGQTGDYTTTFGEDSDYLINPPAYKDNGDGTITDSITGLIWQKEDGGEMTWEQASQYADSLSHGGFDNWRLPTSHELFSIVDHGRSQFSLNTNYFPKSLAEYWWTGTARADDPSRIWVVNAGGGIGPHPKSETISVGGTKRYHVRCVRDVFADSVDHFKINSDGTVSDNFTGLMWLEVEDASPKTWEYALKYCENHSHAGYDDWRLPNIKELRSINMDEFTKPSIDPVCFPKMKSFHYWSSTSEANNPTRAWFVDFNYGLVSYEIKTAEYYICCVRGIASEPTLVNESEDSSNPPADFSVYPVYPNPFNPGTSISFSLSRPAKVSIRVFNINGQFITEIYQGEKSSGIHNIYWDAAGHPSGIYFMLLKAGSITKIQKCTLLK
ncbi:DUF1566 domain-containing protein [candidate division KSB1 bacterium]|nr:DUF1566 domain-containing protein [candidate division KSB1 bacterium]